MALRLQKKNINLVYGHINNVSYYINIITKIFLTGTCVFSNGNLLTESGNLAVAIFANNYRKPTYLVSGCFKFSEKTQIDNLSINESSVITSADSQYQVYDLKYDLIPNKYISLMVTEIGLMPVTCVPVVLRELKLDFEKVTYSEDAI